MKHVRYDNYELTNTNVYIKQYVDILYRTAPVLIAVAGIFISEQIWHLELQNKDKHIVNIIAIGACLIACGKAIMFILNGWRAKNGLFPMGKADGLLRIQENTFFNPDSVREEITMRKSGYRKLRKDEDVLDMVSNTEINFEMGTFLFFLSVIGTSTIGVLIVHIFKLAK